ncbi:hypothetical protein D9619_006648 [Psilocybe cf. subviscida]|uniref:Uncharacterized protein n=1 Tax=Psilocybe cf. subviscida TaxID=2480587 RepID=A0A8H5B549_9AGAR|nr:hypothetical protein D9619_006648 [Psilocybe cf. subviscida]
MPPKNQPPQNSPQQNPQRNPLQQNPPSNSRNPSSPTDLTVKARADTVPAGFPATELVERCLKLIATTTSPIPRDVFTLGQLFTRASSVYEGILALIKHIDNSAVADLDKDWEPFDAYTNAIPPLERFLFDFYQGYAEEKFRSTLPPSDSTFNGVLYVKTWKVDREFISKSFKALHHDDLNLKGLSPQLAKSLIASYTTERQTDDKTLLGALLRFIQDNKLGDEYLEKGAKVPLSIKAMKAELVEIAKKLIASPYDEVASSVIIRTFMYFAIPCTLILSADVEGQWKIYLRKIIIWEAFNSLIVKVKAYVNAPKNADEIEELFSEIEKLLLQLGDTDIATAAEILSLFKLAPVIYRMYHGRSVALIKTLYYLDRHSRKPENKAVATYRYDLKQVMTECVDNLTALSKIKLDIASFSTDSAEYKAKSKEIEGLFDKSKPLFESLRADSLSQYVEAYSTAVSIDESHVKEAKEKLFPSTIKSGG